MYCRLLSTIQARQEVVALLLALQPSHSVGFDFSHVCMLMLMNYYPIEENLFKGKFHYQVPCYIRLMFLNVGACDACCRVMMYGYPHYDTRTSKICTPSTGRIHIYRKMLWFLIVQAPLPLPSFVAESPYYDT